MNAEGDTEESQRRGPDHDSNARHAIAKDSSKGHEQWQRQSAVVRSVCLQTNPWKIFRYFRTFAKPNPLSRLKAKT